MRREMFVRVVTTTLRQRGVPDPDGVAEAIATNMDIVADAMGDGPAPLPSPKMDPQPPPLAWLPPNPEAVVPVQPSLIVTDTRMPEPDERRAVVAPDQQPVRSLRPTVRLKVEDLSQLIQERTPNTLIFEVPMDDGSAPRRMVYARNVISMHAFDCVKLIYFPPGQPQSAQEAVQVEATLHIADVPIDLSAIMKKLAEEAVQILKPRGAPRELPVRPFSGAVQTKRVYADGGSAVAQSADVDQTQTVFKGI